VSDRVLATIGLLVLAVIAGGCLTAMEIAKTPIDRGFSTLLLTFFGTIATALISLLNNRGIAKAADKVELVEKKAEQHQQLVESQLAVNTEMTAATKKTLDRIDGVDVRKEP
jgi:hypothetical protein